MRQCLANDYDFILLLSYLLNANMTVLDRSSLFLSLFFPVLLAREQPYTHRTKSSWCWHTFRCQWPLHHSIIESKTVILWKITMILFRLIKWTIRKWQNTTTNSVGHTFKLHCVCKLSNYVKKKTTTKTHHTLTIHWERGSRLSSVEEATRRQAQSSSNNFCNKITIELPPRSIQLFCFSFYGRTWAGSFEYSSTDCIHHTRPMMYGIASRCVRRARIWKRQKRGK